MLVAYTSKDWRVINWSITALSFSILYLIILFVPESPRYYLAKNRIQDAISILNRIAQLNGLEIDLKDIDLKDELSESKNLKAILQFLTKPSLANLKMTLILLYIWTSVTMVYFGLSLGITSLNNIDPYLIYFLSSLFECVGYILCHVNKKFSCKISLIFYLGLSACMCLAMSLVSNPPNSKVTLNALFISLFALIGKASASATYSLAMVYTSFLYPTRFRSTFVLFVVGFGKIGSIVSPQINISGALIWPPLPFVIFSSCSFLACILVFFLPSHNDQS